jgi:hypothetical protein
MVHQVIVYEAIMHRHGVECSFFALLVFYLKCSKHAS